MAHLTLVKNLAQLQEEQKHIDEVVLDHVGLSLMRGSIAEVVGQPSSGKTSVALSLLAKLTAEGEVCAVVDASHGFDPCTASLGNVILENLLWVRCGHNVDKAFMTTDYLVQAKGFGCIWLNLNGLPDNKLRMVPKTYWYRYRTRIKDTQTLILVTAAESLTGSASQQSFTFEREQAEWSGSGKF
ncbi:MAG TPA: hypothetical protein VGO43_14950, partial [Pyrinomonadaceae bacterium]|nr:hypothetical protein [Pyrinomonadaceae bacterium]